MINTENIFYGEFPKSVIDQAAAAERMRTSTFLSRRLDLRGKAVFAFTETYSSPSACAFSLYRKGDGWELGIHLSDVCEYVCENSPMDIEARKRRAAISNGDISGEMLPEEIVHGVCDLADSGDMLAISALIELDENGNVVSTEFEESVICISLRCIYDEIDRLNIANYDSSVMLLREKYAPVKGILDDMYELAAKFYARRMSRGGLDCPYSRRVYHRDGAGKIISFSREDESDCHAMLKEVCYFAAEAVGKFMLDHKLPCIFNGREAISEKIIDRLNEISCLTDNFGTAAERTAKIAELAKGTSRYPFICDTIASNIPAATFSDTPIYNVFCACDHIVSLFNPTTRYTDLIIQRILKTAIAAKNIHNINISRHLKDVRSAVIEANAAEQFIFRMRKRFNHSNACEFIRNNMSEAFAGYPFEKTAQGEICVALECGPIAVIPAEYAENCILPFARSADFEIITAAEERKILVKPADALK